MSTKPTATKPSPSGKQSTIDKAGANKLVDAVAAVQKTDSVTDAKDDAVASKKR